MARARTGSELPLADPGALRVLVRGLRLLTWSMLTFCALPALMMIVMSLAMMLFEPDTDSVIEGALNMVVTVLSVASPLIGIVLWCVGWWSVSRGTRAIGSLPDAPRARFVLKWATIDGLLAFAASVVLGVVRTQDNATVWVVFVFGAVCLLVGAVGGLWILRAVAKQTTKSAQVSAATQLMVTSPLLVVGLVAIMFTEQLERSPIGQWVSLTSCALVVWPIALIILVWKLHALARYATWVQQARPAAGTPPENV